MGTWSAEPVGNDTAADFVAELDGQKRWTVVKTAFAEATKAGPALDSDVACTAIAAAEVVAHGIGHPTQTDAYTAGIHQFVSRARRPNRRLTEQAIQAVRIARSPEGELAELWDEDDAGEWRAALDRLIGNLGER